MNKKFILISLLLLFLSGLTSADYLVKGATVSLVSNTIGNTQDFYIIVNGGTGVCVDSQIRFPYPKNSYLEKSFDRAFSIALTAYASGQQINVYDYDETSTGCDGAESIRLTK